MIAFVYQVHLTNRVVFNREINSIKTAEQKVKMNKVMNFSKTKKKQIIGKSILRNEIRYV